jgi:hypothetical protein
VAERLRGRPWIWALLVAFVFALTTIPRMPVYTGPDMTEYLNQVYTLLGDSPTQAREKSSKVFCSQMAQPYAINFDPTGPYEEDSSESKRDCEKRLHKEGKLPSDTKYGPGITKSGPIVSGRYEAIWLSRPGIAWMYVPAVALLPDRLGVSVTALALTLLSGLLVFVALRRLGASTPWAVLGQALLYLLPIGAWNLDPRESPVTTLTTVVLLGVVYLLTNRPRWGYLLLIGAFAVGFVCKYSQFMVLGAALAGTAVIAALLARRTGQPIRPLLQVATIGFTAAVLSFLGAKALGWPGGSESMQDLLTVHFNNPDVPDPITQWLKRNGYYWPWWITEQLRSPMTLFGWLFGAWSLWRSRTPIGFAVLAVALTGISNEIGHPEPGQLDRLMNTVWLLTVFGVPLLGQHTADRPEQVTAEPQPLASTTA